MVNLGIKSWQVSYINEEQILNSDFESSKICVMATIVCVNGLM